MAEEIALIRIINGSVGGGGDSPGSSETPTKPGSSSKSGFEMSMSSVLKGLGIATAAAAIAQIVSTWKPLINMVEMILKMIGWVLMPIANVVMVMLMPILFMLKPIIQAVNQVMAPFIKDAMQIMKASSGKGLVAMQMGIGAAQSVMMLGLGAIILQLLGMVAQFMIDNIMNVVIMIWQALASLLEKLPFFTKEGLAKVTTSLVDFRDNSDEMIKTGTDKAVNFLKTSSNTITTEYVSAMDKLITKTKEFKTEVDNINVTKRGGRFGTSGTSSSGSTSTITALNEFGQEVCAATTFTPEITGFTSGVYGPVFESPWGLKKTNG
jgi:hypothetical protein